MAKALKGTPEQTPVMSGIPANVTDPKVATTTGDDGSTFYAWRKDGRKPNVPADWSRNIHGALSPLGDADFADRTGPQ